MQCIRATTFGGFTLEANGNSISASDNRSKKIWCLLGYLICNPGRHLSQDALIELLWGQEPDSNNPVNVLRITLHRLRSLLDTLWPGAGKDLILYKDGGYCLNSSIKIETDFDQFQKLLSASSRDGELYLDNLLKALSLYQGEFLPKLAGEFWAIPMAAHYHNLFLDAALEAAALLQAQGQYAQAAQICQTASAVEPYHEELHQVWMKALSAGGDPRAAATVYDDLNRRLFDDFGIRPSEQTREVYRTCALSPEDRTIPMDEVLEHLKEPGNTAGAMVCDYDYFKVLCFAEKRSMERNGNASHVALFSVAGAGESLSRKSLERIMGQLSRQIQVNLRRGDVVSQCSVSQLIVMLPNANYENSCMVCRRLLAAFRQTYPHVKAKVNFLVQPLTPYTSMP